MGLYAIGDPHLSLKVNKPMDIFGDRWKNHEKKLEEGLSVLSEDDTLVILGDISWAMTVEDALPDFLFLNNLPGKKIISKGNHDYWWQSSKKLNQFIVDNNLDNIRFVYNNSYPYGDSIALCATRGWCLEDEDATDNDKKIIRREAGRLELSLSSAKAEEKIVFLHYPPIYRSFSCEEIIEVMKKHDVKKCFYAHLHGYSCQYAFEGERDGIEYKLVSSDFLNFHPYKIM